MSTFSIQVQTYQKKRDGKSPIVIRLTHKREKKYLKTEFYATEKQLDKDGKIKDRFLIRQLNHKIEDYEDIIIKRLGNKVDLYDAKELKAFLIKSTNTGTDRSLDFISFSLEHIEKIKPLQKSRSRRLKTTLNSLIDFSSLDKIPIAEITSKTLKSFEQYLLSPHTIVRKNQFGKEITSNRPPLSFSCVRDYMGDIRNLLNEAKKKYNDEDKGEIIIAHDPFAKYENIKKKSTRHRNLDVETIRRIINCPDIKTRGSHGVNRANLARDVASLSFFLVGMNTIDLYNADELKAGRITYNRSKTEERREDDALISIKVEPEAMQLIEKYKDKTGKRVFSFHQMYSTMEIFNSAVNKGLKQVSTELKLDVNLTTYHLRHSWATIARNDCGVSKDDVHMALNHVDKDMKITDIYIAKDWSIIDNANRKVIDKVK